jgi:hypothetical protein
MADNGTRPALPHHPGWDRARRGIEQIRLGDTAVTVDASPSRSLPGYRLLRVERFGETLPPAEWPRAVDALAALARRGPRVLRLTVEVYSRDAARRASLGELLARAGFARQRAPRNWSTTLALDLQPGEDELFQSFSSSARKSIRSMTKAPVAVRVIADAGWAPRIDDLMQQTFARTGGQLEALWDWAGVIALSRSAPDASRLVGMFRTDRAGPESLLGFAWGWWNGASVSYFAGASARPTDIRVQIGHPLIWDLICWAKRQGAEWFDLGGVTDGTVGPDDPRGGISDFKRLFSNFKLEVADDWTLEPHRLQARFAALVNRGAAWFARNR